MISTVKANYSNGVLTPLEPLDLREGSEVTLHIENAPSPKRTPRPSTDAIPTAYTQESVAEMFARIHESVPESVWSDLPDDGAMNVRHYLYGKPKENEDT